MLTHVLPLSVWRLADRCDKAMDRGEGVDRIFLLLEELSAALLAAGFPGAAEWVKEIVDEGGDTVMAA